MGAEISRRPFESFERPLKISSFLIGYGAAAVHAASKGHLPVLRRLLDWRAAPQPLLAERAEFYQHRSVAEYLRGLESHEL